MRMNGEAAQSTEHNLIDPFYLFARMHKIPFFSECVIEEEKWREKAHNNIIEWYRFAQNNNNNNAD